MSEASWPIVSQPLQRRLQQRLQQRLKDLARAFHEAFDPTPPCKHLPTFKKRGRDDALRFPQGVALLGNRVHLPKRGGGSCSTAARFPACSRTPP